MEIPSDASRHRSSDCERLAHKTDNVHSEMRYPVHSPHDSVRQVVEMRIVNFGPALHQCENELCIISATLMSPEIRPLSATLVMAKAGSSALGVMSDGR